MDHQISTQLYKNHEQLLCMNEWSTNLKPLALMIEAGVESGKNSDSINNSLTLLSINYINSNG